MSAVDPAQPAVDLIVPGSIEQLTGGYLYDRRIIDGLGEIGWQTRVLSVDPSFPEPSATALAAAGRLLDSLPERRRVVIDGLALTGLEPLLAAAARRLELFALIHHPLALETGLDAITRERLRERERAALAHVDRVIVTSRWTRDALTDYGVEPQRISVVEPGVDRGPLPPARTPAATLRLLSVGTLTPRKGHAVLIEALARIADRAWVLRCAGSLDRDPATVADVRARISRHRLDARVELIGELPPAAVAGEYAAADLFVLASHLEGYGMVVAEAVAHGLPVVAARAGAVGDTLPPGAGTLVPPGDAESLAAAIARLCDDRTALAVLTDGARRASASVPTWADSVAHFATALERQPQ